MPVSINMQHAVMVLHCTQGLPTQHGVMQLSNHAA